MKVAFLFHMGDEYLPWHARWFTRGEFRHVTVLLYADRVVIKLEQKLTGLETTVLRHPYNRYFDFPLDAAVYFHVTSLKDVKAVFMDWQVKPDKTSHGWGNFYPGCVTLAKQVLGINAWVFRPQAFYEWLLRHGGQVYSNRRLKRVRWRIKRDMARGVF